MLPPYYFESTLWYMILYMLSDQGKKTAMKLKVFMFQKFCNVHDAFIDRSREN